MRNMKKKKIILFLCTGMALILVGMIVLVFFINKPNEVESFDVANYEYEMDNFGYQSNSIIFTEIFPSGMILGPIDNERMAKEAAEGIWLKIYGNSVKKQKPYRVFFDEANDVWLITGSMPRRLLGNVVGGVAYIIIQKTDGKVLAVWHGK